VDLTRAGSLLLRPPGTSHELVTTTSFVDHTRARSLLLGADGRLAGQLCPIRDRAPAVLRRRAADACGRQGRRPPSSTSQRQLCEWVCRLLRRIVVASANALDTPAWRERSRYD